MKGIAWGETKYFLCRFQKTGKSDHKSKMQTNKQIATNTTTIAITTINNKKKKTKKKN